MQLSQFLLPEFDAEMAYSRKHLERVPMDKLDFKPHDKSMPLGWLATFLAVLPSWGALIITSASFDVAPGGVPIPQQSVLNSRDALLEMFDDNVAAARAAIAGATEEQLTRSWSLLAAGNAIFTQPGFLVFRTYFLNHMVHHRAQLGMFLRMTGVAVPAIYNDSADESGGMFIDSAANR
ncbi:MAG: damage-inducible protein DinB [Anaerolineae bacterium]|nr:damage-inducible protein DinB [Gemmatimonadaceae bacterium]